jgi:hypothetical protein
MDMKIILVHPSVEEWLYLKKKNHRADRVDELPECRYRHPDFWHHASQDIRGGHTKY